ncbi:MAG: L-threonylcarbamoyladenylate synthase [Desulfobacterales bacterium]|jgi:L-threonylcarbamoyladenylate synthase
MNPSIIRKINSDKPEPEIIDEAAAIIRQGGVVAFPTRCLYGLGADAFDSAAVDRVVRIKQRPADNPILVLIDCRQRLKDLVAHIPPAAETLMQAFWPGGLTLVFKAQETLSHQLIAGSAKIGVRIPAHAVALALVKQAGRPITGTSANISGHPGCHRAPDLDRQITTQVDMILDGGTLDSGVGSTVIDITGDPPRILREGQVSADEIRGCLSEI